MNALKIKLQKPKPIGWVTPGNKIIPLLTARPYYKGKRGTYTHVIRSGRWFSNGHRKCAESYMIFDFWCGAFGSNKIQGRTQALSGLAGRFPRMKPGETGQKNHCIFGNGGSPCRTSRGA